MSLPFAILTLIGHPDTGLQMAAGAFVALFAANSGARERAKILPCVAVALLVCAALGATLAPWAWLTAAGLVVVTIVTCALAHAFRLGAPGPVFFVLTYGLAGNITAVVDGQRLNNPWVFLAALAAGMLFSYLLALAPLLRTNERRKPSRPLRQLLPGPWLGQGEWELIARSALVALAGTAISIIWLDPHRAYWTVSAGIAVIGLTAGRRPAVGRGLHRLVGTMLGAGLYLAIAPLGRVPMLLVLLLAVLQFAIEQVVVRNYALALVFITPLVLLITSAATGGTALWEPAFERLGDTAVGAALAVLTGLIHRRVR